MEVTVNKTFVMVSDIIKATNKKENPSSIAERHDSSIAVGRMPKDFEPPDLPFTRMSKLSMFNKMIKKKEVYDYMVS